MKNNKQVKQHEPIRVPERWTGQERMLIIQLERLMDEIYARLGDLEKRIKALEEE